MALDTKQNETFYRALRGGGDSSFPWKSIWKTKEPSGVAFFSWTVTLGGILTINNFRERQVTIVDWCCMCKIFGEITYCLWVMPKK